MSHAARHHNICTSVYFRLSCIKTQLFSRILHTINALSNRIRFQTGFKLESIHVKFKRERVKSQAARRTLYIATWSFIFQITFNKNTIISNSRDRMFPKFT